MAIRVAINHHTAYHYDRLVGLSPQVIRLRPAPHCRTPIVSYSQKITPAEHFINWQQDPQSNWMARVVFPEKVRKFAVDLDVDPLRLRHCRPEPGIRPTCGPAWPPSSSPPRLPEPSMT